MKLNKVYGLLLASVIVVAAPVQAQQTEITETHQDSTQMNMAQGMDKSMSKSMEMGTDSMKSMPRQEDMNPATMKMQMQMNNQNRHPMNSGADAPENNKQ